MYDVNDNQLWFSGKMLACTTENRVLFPDNLYICKVIKNWLHCSGLKTGHILYCQYCTVYCTVYILSNERFVNFWQTLDLFLNEFAQNYPHIKLKNRENTKFSSTCPAPTKKLHSVFAYAHGFDYLTIMVTAKQSWFDFGGISLSVGPDHLHSHHPQPSGVQGALRLLRVLFELQPDGQ